MYALGMLNNFHSDPKAVNGMIRAATFLRTRLHRSGRALEYTGGLVAAPPDEVRRGLRGDGARTGGADERGKGTAEHDSSRSLSE